LENLDHLQETVEKEQQFGQQQQQHAIISKSLENDHMVLEMLSILKRTKSNSVKAHDLLLQQMCEYYKVHLLFQSEKKHGDNYDYLCNIKYKSDDEKLIFFNEFDKFKSEVGYGGGKVREIKLSYFLEQQQQQQQLGGVGGAFLFEETCPLVIRDDVNHLPSEQESQPPLQQSEWEASRFKDQYGNIEVNALLFDPSK
jgi:hypothetical protein